MTEAEQKPARRKKGLVIVNTGNGKGKSTAAIGMMTRAWGRDMKVGVVQFLKHEKARFGEIKAAERMGIDWIATGDGFTWTSKDMDETEARARHGWEIAKERIAGGQYDLLILDEFTYTMHFEWLDTNEVIAWLKANKPPTTPDHSPHISTDRGRPANRFQFLASIANLAALFLLKVSFDIVSITLLKKPG